MNEYLQGMMDLLEERMNDKSIPNNIAYRLKTISVMIYWFVEETNNTLGKYYYKKALEILYELYKENPKNIWVYFAVINMNIKLEKYDEAYILLKSLLKHKKYYEQSNNTIYGMIYYFKALLDYYSGKHMFIQKSIKIFEECLEDNKSGVLLYLKTNLDKDLFNEEKNEIHYYYEAFKHRFHSPFLYYKVYQLFCLSPSSFYQMNDMMKTVFMWAIRYNVLDEKGALLFSDWIQQNKESIKIPESYVKKAYNKWDTNGLLSLLCKIYIKNHKKDKETLAIYSKAIDKNLFIEGIYQAYVEIAKELDFYDIPSSILQANLLKDIHQELLAYVYAIVCKKAKHKIHFQINYKKIFNFGMNALKTGKKGKYFIDIYIKLLEKNPNHNQLKKIIFEHLFLYEVKVHSSLIKYLWIVEKEKKNMVTYTVNNEYLFIEAAAEKKENLTILCVGQRQKSFYMGNLISVNQLVKDISIGLLFKFYDEGYKNSNLLIVLTKFFIQMIKKNKEINMPKKAEKIMLECLEDSTLSDSFRKETSAAIGTLLAINNHLEKAALYFSPLSFKELSPSQIQHGINALLEGKEVLKAIEWAQSVKELNDEIRYNLTKKAIQLEINKPYIINTAFNLLLKKKYDKEILAYVIDNYEGTMKDWYALRDTLLFLEKSTVDLDKKILKKGIWTRGLNNRLEEVFQSLYDEKIPISKAFIDYCNYEILINQKNITNRTIEIFEKVFEKTKNMILGYSILDFYGRNNMDAHDKTEITNPIYMWMKNYQFILPIIKEKQDIFPYSSYIEQNEPFIHTTKGGREVYFCYKIKGFPLNKKKMHQIAFNLYGTCVSLFYNESMEYYIEETDEVGNIYITDVKTYHHELKKIKMNPKDIYERLNNVIIHHNDSDYEKAEEMLEEMIIEDQRNDVGYLL